RPPPEPSRIAGPPGRRRDSRPRASRRRHTPNAPMLPPRFRPRRPTPAATVEGAACGLKGSLSEHFTNGPVPGEAQRRVDYPVRVGLGAGDALDYGAAIVAVAATDDRVAARGVPEGAGAGPAAAAARRPRPRRRPYLGAGADGGDLLGRDCDLFPGG